MKGFVEYDVGGSTLGVGNGAEMFKPGARGCVVALEVDDIAAAYQRVKEHEVTLLFETFRGPKCDMLGVADPDGNSLLLHRRKSRAG